MRPTLVLLPAALLACAPPLPSDVPSGGRLVVEVDVSPSVMRDALRHEEPWNRGFARVGATLDAVFQGSDVELVFPRSLDEGMAFDGPYRSNDHWDFEAVRALTWGSRDADLEPGDVWVHLVFVSGFVLAEDPKLLGHDHGAYAWIPEHATLAVFPDRLLPGFFEWDPTEDVHQLFAQVVHGLGHALGLGGGEIVPRTEHTDASGHCTEEACVMADLGEDPHGRPVPELDAWEASEDGPLFGPDCLLDARHHFRMER